MSEYIVFTEAGPVIVDESELDPYAEAGELFAKIDDDDELNPYEL